MVLRVKNSFIVDFNYNIGVFNSIDDYVYKDISKIYKFISPQISLKI